MKYGDHPEFWINGEMTDYGFNPEDEVNLDDLAEENCHTVAKLYKEKMEADK